MRRRHGMGRRESIIWLRVLWRNFGDLLLRPCCFFVLEVVGKKMSPRSGIRSVDFKIAPFCDDDVGRFASHFKLTTANALANSIVAPRDGRVELTFVVARPISMIHRHTRCGAADWRPASHYLRCAASPALGYGLRDSGPLTLRLRLRCRCGEAFRVAVRRQCWERPAADERRVLEMRPAERALIREVHLLCGDTPWVFARTVMPVSSLRGRRRRLMHLGDKPLGAALFADPHLCRGALELARLRRGEVLYEQAGSRDAAEIWGRRSVFRLQGRPLLVTEIFLPALLQPHPSATNTPHTRRGIAEAST